jgi:hypothetical protein
MKRKFDRGLNALLTLCFLAAAALTALLGLYRLWERPPEQSGAKQVVQSPPAESAGSREAAAPAEELPEGRPSPPHGRTESTPSFWWATTTAITTPTP